MILRVVSSRTMVLTLEHAPVTWSTCKAMDGGPLPPEFLVREVWDGALEYTFLTSSLKWLMFLDWRTHSEKHYSRTLLL